MFRAFRLALTFIALGLVLGAVAAIAVNFVIPASPTQGSRMAGALATPSATSTPPITTQSVPPPNSMVFTQADVNDQVKRALREVSSPVPVRDVQVTLLGDNRVEATGRATVPLQGEVPLTVAMTVAGAGGKLQVTVDSVRAGGLPLPQPIVQQLVGQVMNAAGIQDLKNIALPQGYDSVTVEEGRIVVRRRA